MQKTLLILLFISVCSATLVQGHLRREDNLLNHDARRGGSSLGASLIGFIIGPILFIWSFIFIWNNERKAAIDYRRIKLVEKIVKSVDPMKES